MESKTYEIHDNGGVPFLVQIFEDNTVVISGNKNLRYKVMSYFIGKSPNVKMADVHGPEYDGNTILLRLSQNRYVFVGPNIILFDYTVPIVDFISIIGNNDVPYPYAIDERGRYILFNDLVIVSVIYGDNPYEYYYNTSTVNDIVVFCIGNTAYNMSYSPFPGKNYKRLGPLGVMKGSFVGQSLKVLSKRDYIKIMKKHGDDHGFFPLKHKVIYTWNQ